MLEEIVININYPRASPRAAGPLVLRGKKRDGIAFVVIAAAAAVAAAAVVVVVAVAVAVVVVVVVVVVAAAAVVVVVVVAYQQKDTGLFVLTMDYLRHC